MREPVWPLVSAAEMRALDAHTIDELGVSGEVLMESAGRAVVAQVLALLAPGGRVLVACGGGNNGGDGYVVARHLHGLRVPVEIWGVGDPARLRGDAAANRARAERLGVPVTTVPELAAGTVIVDAIFGTGLSRAVEGDAAQAIARVRSARSARTALTVVAIDLPSGLDADTGQPLGDTLEADVTVTIGLPKIGLALEPGRSLAGRIVVARIGIADETPMVRPGVGSWTRAAAGARIPARPSSGHKGSFGHLLLVAGSEGKTGAAVLAAAGAHRVGVGLVTVACPLSTNSVLESQCTEAMTAPVPETDAREFARVAEKAILEFSESRTVTVAGPGAGRGHETQDLLRAVALGVATPLVLDADGIAAFAGEPGALLVRRAPTILTPHPGEAAMLLGGEPAELNRDRVGAARKLTERTGAIDVLKGAGTVIAGPDGRVLINPTGGPALAAGGSGDVLAGMVGGFLAQGMDAFEAAALAAFVHGAAADAWTELRGQVGLLASELAAAIPETLEALRAAQSPVPFGAADALDFPEPG